MNLNRIAEIAYTTALIREKNGAFKKNDDVLKHCAGEVMEAQEAFLLWKIDAKSKSAYAEELADIILCALIAAARDAVDIETAIQKKIEKNKKRAAMQGDKND